MWINEFSVILMCLTLKKDVCFVKQVLKYFQMIMEHRFSVFELFIVYLSLWFLKLCTAQKLLVLQLYDSEFVVNSSLSLHILIERCLYVYTALVLGKLVPRRQSIFSMNSYSIHCSLDFSSYFYNFTSSSQPLYSCDICVLVIVMIT